ncbi:olfactory receptor 7E24-like [Fukomys damarensis]|nr:olfactory receptor 7E24-like [Fukomys damarensis]
MYFFLFTLSFDDICLISSTVPKFVVGILTHSKVISYVGCLIQMSFFMLFACTDSMLLTVMAYDRFVAICHPLYYATIMNPRLCVLLILLSVFSGLLEYQLCNLTALQLSCFQDVKIASFFCDPSQLLYLTCSDALIKNIVTYMIGILFDFFPLSGITFSYYKIVSALLKIPSSGGRYKAFSTCDSHVSVVCLYYGSGLRTYLGSALSYSPCKGDVASLMYSVVTPLLNPFLHLQPEEQGYS